MISFEAVVFGFIIGLPVGLGLTFMIADINARIKKKKQLKEYRRVLHESGVTTLR